MKKVGYNLVRSTDKLERQEKALLDLLYGVYLLVAYPNRHLTGVTRDGKAYMINGIYEVTLRKESEMYSYLVEAIKNNPPTPRNYIPRTERV